MVMSKTWSADKMKVCQLGTMECLIREPMHLLEKNPTILFLHGAGTRGNDAHLLENNPFFCSNYICMEDSPFLIFAPQCREDTWFDVFEQLKAFALLVRADPRVDPERIYLIGASMGGYAAWQLAMSMPDTFAAMVPICGGGMSWNAKRIAHLPIWALHGKEDPTVPYAESVYMVDAIHKAGGNARLTLLDGVRHNSWEFAFSHGPLWTWLLQQRKSDCHQAGQEDFADINKFG